MSTPTEIFTATLRVLGIMGAAESTPSGEDGELCRTTFNRMMGQWNTRGRNAYFIRQQSFAFSVARETYSIGTAANSANFVVTAGARPAKILSAQLVMTDVDPPVQINMAVINQDQYQLITIPELASQFPNILYYQPTFPNGTIRPWPAFPTETAFELNLQWWNQLLTVAVADVGTELSLPDGYEEAAVMSLAEKLWLAYPKRTNLDELKRQARRARADIQGLNISPPKINTTDGLDSPMPTFNWITRQA